MKNPLIRDYFSKSDKEKIVKAIQEAELNTSGEIRVYFENSTKKMDTLDRAYQAFKKLEMDQTDLQNGVLIYIAFKDHKCAIIGDAGIHKKVGDAFWKEELEIMRSHFRNGKYTEGLTKVIKLAGERLSEYFPYQRDDKNELSDDIYFDEEN
ncbi:TPM domain-containing protein [Membranihabitans maritimus]|uniref:TPM domain-containing protein n=1 Tax=Membranihabitans maritimus TaxID=2904244 RepID=UPI001F1DC9F2|nr:TPM domain-containing protein [Membranihabitans maritimus]